MKSSPSKPAPREILKPKSSEGWFATFTILDVSGAIGSSQLRRWSSTVSKAWRATLRSLSDRSKSRAVGV